MPARARNRSRFVVGLVVAWVACGAVAQAQTADPPVSTDTVTAAPPPTPPAAGSATRDYLAEARARFTPESRAYNDTKTLIRFVEPFYGILIGLGILFSGLSARMRDIAHQMGPHRYVRVLVYLTLYSLLGFALGFPLAWYNGFAIEHQYGLSNQTFWSWLREEGIGLVVGLVFFGVVPLIALAYTAIEKSPRRWWLWLGLGTIPVIIIGTLIQPLVIDPLTNKFTPLRNQHLKQQILQLAEKADIPGRNVYEVDKSTQTKKFNAYVNGFGTSQRIVLWDTTLQGMSEDEILYVMGHEMGHYKLGHIWKGIAFFSLLSLVLFFIGARLMRRATDRFGDRWGFHELHDVASLPLLSLVLSVIVLFTQPMIYAHTRGVETEADIYGLEITRANDAAARAFVKLGSQNKSNPEPSEFVKIWLYSHPPDGERIRRALSYKPWTEAKPNRFFTGGP
ncbi:MAG TPA: M48 family metallopeptidase [Candidatus Limnocylindria bacterium]|nr:M48 family metallopeptidase [Candidatus Limnocylindria bacterium]